MPRRCLRDRAPAFSAAARWSSASDTVRRHFDSPSRALRRARARPDRGARRAAPRSAPPSPWRRSRRIRTSPSCDRSRAAIGGPAVRAMATVGGNLFAPSPYGDFAVALLALGAEVSRRGRRAAARRSASKSFSRERAKRAAGIVTQRRLRPAAARKLPLHEGRCGGIRMALRCCPSPRCCRLLDGRISGARVAYGAMAPTPIRARAVEKRARRAGARRRGDRRGGRRRRGG